MKIPFFQDNVEGSDAQKARVESCQRLYNVADSTRRFFEDDWMNNAMYLSGNQQCAEAVRDDYLRLTRRALRPPETGKVWLVSNRILPLARQVQSSITESPAVQIATPSTSDKSDVDAAELATTAIQGRYWEDREHEKQLLEVGWALVAGSCMRHTYYDPDAAGRDWRGEIVPGLGDVTTEVVNPFRCHVAPWYDSQGLIPWLIESDARDVDEINDLFPGHDVEPESCADVTGRLDKLLVNIVEHRDSQPAVREHAAILKRLNMRPDPSKGNDQGKLVIWSNGKLLYDGNLPDGEFTWARKQWFPIVGRVYPLPFISPLRDLQKQINIILSQLIELKNRQLRGDIVVSGPGTVTQEYALDEDNRKTSQKVIRVPTGIAKWDFMHYELSAGEAEKLIVQLWNDMREIAGVHEPTSGAGLDRNTTATEIMRLVESDMKNLTIFRSGFDHTDSDICRHKIMIMQKHYDMPRMIRVVGENYSVQTPAFFGSDLGNTQDVRPKPVPLVTETVKLKIRQEAVAAGLYGPYAGPEDMLAKITALLNSGIPDVQTEVDQIIAPMTIEELREIVGQINATRAKGAVIAEQARIAAMMVQLQAMTETSEGEGQPGTEEIPQEAAIGA